jgi:zinc transport system substrate-binding protein
MLLLVAAGCAAGGADGASGPGSLRVVAASYPLEFLAERVAGQHAAVTGLAPPGVEAHDLELSPSQVAEVGRADLVIYLPGFQPAVDEAVAAHATGSGFDASSLVPLLPAEPGPGTGTGTGQEHAANDPHVWLDPDRLATIAGGLAAALGEADPGHAAGYAANAAAVGAELADLDAELASGLAGCQRREIVVSHAAFGYLADRYDLHQIAITGLSPEDEPTPRRLAEVVHLAERHGATTIFFEVLVSPAVAEVVADEVGAQTAVLDPVEGLAPGSGEDYFSLMRANLAALRTALDCQ